MIDMAFVLASCLAFKDGTARRPKMATNGNLFPVEPGLLNGVRGARCHWRPIPVNRATYVLNGEISFNERWACPLFGRTRDSEDV